MTKENFLSAQKIK